MTRPVPPDAEEPVAALVEAARHAEAFGAEKASHRTAKRLGPWMASVMVHLTLIVLGFLIPWTTRLILEDHETPPAIMAEFDNLAPTSLNAEALDATDDASALQYEDRHVTPERKELDDLLNRIDAEAVDLTGPSSLDEALRAFSPRGSGQEVTFGGLRGTNARRIVYVVDASGSMLMYLPVIINELTQSIDRLTDTQEFAVIFFQRNEAILVPGPHGQQGAVRKLPRRPKLLPATQENKLHVFNWIDLDSQNVRASGKSNPITALELALERLDPTPDVVFILSTDITGVGEYEVEQADLLTMIRKLNRRKSGLPGTVLKTIQFVYEDPLGTLKLIAEQNGGADGYKFLTREELGLDR